MATTYSITFTLDNATIKSLFAQNMYLCGYKGVRSGATGMNPIWFSTNDFSPVMNITWEEQYYGYVQQTIVQADGVISVFSTPNSSGTRRITGGNALEMNLGQNFTVSADGETNVSTIGGHPNELVITNDPTSTRQWACGMAQSAASVTPGTAGGDSLVATCAFTLGLGQTVTMAPIEIVLLEFRSIPVVVGTVMEATNGSCLLLTFPPDAIPPITSLGGISYNANTSPEWVIAGGPSWGKILVADSELATNLIQS